jgi:hypothetical protein
MGPLALKPPQYSKHIASEELAQPFNIKRLSILSDAAKAFSTAIDKCAATSSPAEGLKANGSGARKEI